MSTTKPMLILLLAFLLSSCGVADAAAAERLRAQANLVREETSSSLAVSDKALEMLKQLDEIALERGVPGKDMYLLMIDNLESESTSKSWTIAGLVVLTILLSVAYVRKPTIIPNQLQSQTHELRTIRGDMVLYDGVKVTLPESIVATLYSLANASKME